MRAFPMNGSPVQLCVARKMGAGTTGGGLHVCQDFPDRRAYGFGQSFNFSGTIDRGKRYTRCLKRWHCYGSQRLSDGADD